MNIADKCWLMIPYIGGPPDGWFTTEKPIQVDDLGLPLFQEPPKWENWRNWGFLEENTCAGGTGHVDFIGSCFLY